ncbi:MAG: cobalamin B12-binding domain-containing protein [Chloroflexi bacterium]|nr:MAG: cobalamin B12-binding domain-containing protein [Chloroflexota bacterium]
MLAVETWKCGSAARFPVRDLIAALLDGDGPAAYELAERVLLETRSRTAVFADLLHPAQAEIGNLWYAGRVSYADEVRAAVHVRRIVERLAPTPAPRPVRRGSRCVLAVPHGDPHDVGLMMLSRALEDHGWSTELVGPARGLADLPEIVLSRRPRLFGLSAALLPPLAQVEQAIAAIRQARVPVLVGGVAFNRRPDLWRRLGADGLGTDVRVGVVLAGRLGGR